MTAPQRPTLAISLRILSGLLMAGMYACVKTVSDDVPLGQIVFFRSLFAILPLIVFLWVRHEFPGGLATKRPGAHFVRASFGALALFGSFAAVSRLNLSEAILIAQLSPIFMAIGAAILLSERLTKWRVWGLVVGFGGVVVLVWPDLNAASADRSARLLGYAIGFVAAFLSAVALLMVRSLSKTESPGAIALYFVLASMIGSLVTLPWGWVTPDFHALGVLILSGLLGGFGHIAMTLAFRYAEASRLASIEYVALLWPLLADVFIFGLGLPTALLLAAPLILAGAAISASERG